MAWVMFDPFMEGQYDGNAIDCEGDVRCMLIDDTRQPVGASDASMTDIDDNEVSGDGYTALGHDFASPTITLAAGTVTFDAEDPTWSQGAAGFTDARYAVIFFNTGTAATSIPICYADLGGDVGNDAGTLTLELNAAGIWTLSD